MERKRLGRPPRLDGGPIMIEKSKLLRKLIFLKDYLILYIFFITLDYKSMEGFMNNFNASTSSFNRNKHNQH